MYRAIPELTDKQLQRFWKRVSPEPNTGCFLWLGGASEYGYGVTCLKHGGPYFYASRIMYKLHYGTDPEHLCVLHRCDNPPCVNPQHLFLGTRADNVADMKAKGRAARGDRTGPRLHPETLPRGERHSRAKVTAADVLEIRRLWDEGLHSQAQLGTRYGLTASGVQAIVERRNWNHV